MKKEYSKRFYVLVKTVSSGLMKAIYNAEVIGSENIPAEGPIVLAGNHTSMLDIPLVWYASSRHVRFLAKKEIFDVPVVSKMGHMVGAIPIDRDKLDLQAVRDSIKLLRNGEVLGIFPEGTRNKNDELLPFHPGATNLAIKTKALVVPFGISGEFHLNSKITIRFGEAMQFAGYQNDEATECLKSKILELKRR